MNYMALGRREVLFMIAFCLESRIWIWQRQQTRRTVSSPIGEVCIRSA